MSSQEENVSDLVDAVGEDPDLSPREKETSLNWTKDGRPTEECPPGSDLVKIHTEERGLMRRLLRLEHCQLTKFRVLDSSGVVSYIEPLNFSGGTITAVEGYVPVGCVKVMTSRRSTSGHADVVSYRGSGSAQLGGGLDVTSDMGSREPSTSTVPTVEQEDEEIGEDDRESDPVAPPMAEQGGDQKEDGELDTSTSRSYRDGLDW